MTAGSEGVVTLKPCPFCGASDGRLVQTFTRATKDFVYWSVECLDCGCEIADDESQANAYAAWNRRPDAALADQRDEPTDLDRTAFAALNSAQHSDETEIPPVAGASIVAWAVLEIERLRALRREADQRDERGGEALLREAVQRAYDEGNRIAKGGWHNGTWADRKFARSKREKTVDSIVQDLADHLGHEAAALSTPAAALSTPAAPEPTETGELTLDTANEAVIRVLLERYPGRAKRIQDFYIKERGKFCIELWLGEGSGYITISTYPLARAVLASPAAPAPSNEALDAGLAVLRSATHPDRGLVLDIVRAVFGCRVGEGVLEALDEALKQYGEPMSMLNGHELGERLANDVAEIVRHSRARSLLLAARPPQTGEGQ